MMAVPYRKDFIKALSAECSEEVVLSDMEQALLEMTVNLDAITAFYKETGQDKTDKV